MKMFCNSRGITIKELKNILDNFPEERQDGSPTTVWIGSESGDLSSPAIYIWPLDKDCDGKSDLLIASE